MIDALRGSDGGALGVVYLSMAVIITVLLILVNSADYALYSMKKAIISKAMDYAVSAAIQEIDRTVSAGGLAAGFDETTGRLSLDNIALNEGNGDKAFFSTLKANCGIERSHIEENLLIIIINPAATGMNYIMKKGTQRQTGRVARPEELEAVINNRIQVSWNSPAADSDKHVIYVNGNPRTNTFQKRPYYMAFIKDYQIDGVFRKRTATFIAFKAAKMERVER